jgi:selenide,water dikinase
MAQGPPEVTMRIEIDAVPLMDEALDAYHRGMSTGVNRVNRELVASSVRFDRELPGWHEEIFVDPQTSGGLLAAVPAEEAEDVVAALREAGVSSADRIGTVEAHDGRSHLVFV